MFLGKLLLLLCSYEIEDPVGGRQRRREEGAGGGRRQMGGGREQPEVGGHRPVEAVSSCVDAAKCRQGWEADVKPAAHCVARMPDTLAKAGATTIRHTRDRPSVPVRVPPPPHNHTGSSRSANRLSSGILQSLQRLTWAVLVRSPRTTRLARRDRQSVLPYLARQPARLFNF
jgi:hypothetical protein